MKKRKIIGSMLLAMVVYTTTGCSHIQPKKEEIKSVDSTVEKGKTSSEESNLSVVESQLSVENQHLTKSEISIDTQLQNEVIELTQLSTTADPDTNWVPLKIEDEIEWNAKDLLGRRYVWGATGPINYDCSGFTQKIYGDLGIKLPRVSRNQAEEGELVNFDELQKGDLVFFATKKHKPNRVTHVGIYLGKGNFIHASSGAKKVVICNFDKDVFYKNKFLWGRRVIQEKNHYASTENAESFESSI